MEQYDQYEFVVDSLQLVAADADAQIAAVPKFASPTDEVATTFGDAYLLVPQLVRARMVPEVAAEAMRGLDEWFGQMPTDGSVAEASTLGSHPFWSRARSLARKALAIMNVPLRPPQQSHISWMEGNRLE